MTDNQAGSVSFTLGFLCCFGFQVWSLMRRGLNFFCEKAMVCDALDDPVPLIDVLIFCAGMGVFSAFIGTMLAIRAVSIRQARSDAYNDEKGST